MSSCKSYRRQGKTLDESTCKNCLKILKAAVITRCMPPAVKGIHKGFECTVSRVT